MATTAGMSLPQVAVDSLLRSKRDFFFAPVIGTTNYVVASVDPNGVAVGDNFTLATPALGLMFRKARRITMTIDDDDAGGGLSVTARVTGQRWGQHVSEILTGTAINGTAVSFTSVNVYDQVTEIKLLGKVADAGDAVLFGVDDTSFGLDFPIDLVADVQSIINVASDVQQSATAISSTTVIVVASGGSVAGGSYVNVADLSVTDRWEIRYLASRKFDGSGVVGVWR